MALAGGSSYKVLLQSVESQTIEEENLEAKNAEWRHDRRCRSTRSSNSAPIFTDLYKQDLEIIDHTVQILDGTMNLITIKVTPEENNTISMVASHEEI